MDPPNKPKQRAEPRRGEVWMVDFPNRPDDPHLPRLAIVISNDRWNEFADTVLAIPLMNDEKLPRLLPTQVPIAKGIGGTYKDSRAMCEQITSVDKRRFVGSARGSIPSVILTGLVRAIQKAVE